MKTTEAAVRRYLSKIGQKGGKKSRRTLSSEEAKNMVRIREARKAFREFQPQCFWYMRPDTRISLEDIPTVVQGLRLHGGRQGYLRAARLCR